jgi:nucleoid-associated protein YgaU
MPPAIPARESDMGKKLACLLTLCVLIAASSWAQNLLDNEYQKAGREYERQATEAMDSGDYAKAADLANLAAEQYQKSREFADAQALKFRAANAINLAQQTITDVSNGPKRKTHAKEIANAGALLAKARALFAQENWVDSRAKALESLDALKGLTGGTPVATDTSGTLKQNGKALVLPRYYKVIGRSRNTDCLWRIAAMGAVYNNPHLWPKLWKANKDKLRDPENPNLIHPGTVLEIPQAKGETREGTFDPDKTYPALEQ